MKPQQNYPDKSQHLDKLFEIAGQKPKDKQLNTLLQIANGRPNKQSGTGQNQHDNESSFKYEKYFCTLYTRKKVF